MAEKHKPGDVQAAADAVLEHGNISAASKATGIHRRTLQHRLRRAEADGLMQPRTQSNPSRWRPGAEIVAARKAEFERVKASGRRDGNIIHLPDDSPFMLAALGDPHLDASGTGGVSV